MTTTLPTVPPEVMPTADSVADAETLRRGCPFWRGDRIVRAEHQVNADLWIAGWQGQRSAVLNETISTPDLAYQCARIAARAAFRAIPDLRLPDFQSAEDR